MDSRHTKLGKNSWLLVEQNECEFLNVEIVERQMKVNFLREQIFDIMWTMGPYEE